jgi:hypothetical protein
VKVKMEKTGWLIYIWTIVLITGCGSQVTPVTVKPTAFLRPTIAITSLPTNSLSPTSIPIQQPFSTFTPTMANTPTGTLTEHDGECLLPCWWGITPGITTWEEALTKLKDKKSQMIETEEHYNETESKLPNKLGFVWVYRRDDGKVNWIDISSKPLDGIQYYDLLAKYGEPSEIFFFTYNNFQTRPPWIKSNERPANVILYYAGEGILAEYEFFGKLNETTNLITVCPTLTSQELWLDPKGTKYSQSEINQTVLGNGPDVIKIDEATSISKQEFYTLYKDKTQTKCFETPSSLWP